MAQKIMFDEWEGPRVYGNNLGGGGDPGMCSIFIEQLDCHVDPCIGRIIEHLGGAGYDLELGPYPHEQTIFLGCVRSRARAQERALPYCIGYAIALDIQQQQRKDP